MRKKAVIFAVCLFLFLPSVIRADLRNFMKEEYDVPPPIPILAKISEAKELALVKHKLFTKALIDVRAKYKELSQKQKEYATRKSKADEPVIHKLKGEIIALEITVKKLSEKTLLIVLNQATGELKQVLAQESYTTVKSKKHSGKKQNVFQGIRLETEGCSISKVGGNFHGTELMVWCDGYLMPVLSLLHFHEQETPKTKGITHLYTPYSSFLHIPEIVSLGKIYLRDLVLEAKKSVAQKHIPSKAYPEKIVGEGISIEFIEAVIMNEHMDHEAFKLYSEQEPTERAQTIKSLVEKVLVILAINKERAFIFSISNANACCLVQFIPSTYAAVIKEYISAKLDKEFLRGMRDHKNAIEAMMFLFDRDRSYFSLTAERYCSDSNDLMEDCLAVAYNGGPHRVNAVIQTYGEDWDKQKPVKPGKRYLRKGLTNQSVVYLEKIRAIRDYIAQENQRAQK